MEIGDAFGPKQTLAIFIDYQNFEASLRNEGKQTDFLLLKDYLVAGRHNTVKRRSCTSASTLTTLTRTAGCTGSSRTNGFMVRAKLAKVLPDGSLKCNLDVEMVLAQSMTSPTRGPTPASCHRRRGFCISGTVAPGAGHQGGVASTPRCISQDLRELANGYIDLCEAIEEIEQRREITYKRR